MSRLRPSLASSSTAVDREIGSEYDNVKIVADHIDDVILIATEAENLSEISESIITLTPILVDAVENLEEVQETVLQARDNTFDARDTTVAAEASSLLYSQNAKQSELNSAESEENSLQSSEESAASAVNALVSENASAQSEVNSLASENKAKASENLAQEWAINPVDDSVTGYDGQYSAYHHAVKAKASADNAEALNQSVVALEASAQANAEAAAVSAANASTSEINASNDSSAALSARDTVLASETNVVALEQTVQSNTTTVVQLAGEVETNASNLSDAVSSASDSANTATTQAGIATSAANTATTKASEAATSASNASSSEANSLASEQASSQSESNAAASESNASNSASSAATDASSASNSANAAKVSEDSAEASKNTATTQASLANSHRQAAELAELGAETYLSEFNDLYLGKLTNDPTTSKDGSPLEIGVFYYNTTSGSEGLRIYTPTGWDTAVFDASGVVISFNGRKGDISLTNSDVTAATGKDLSTLKSAAFTEVGDYATASQGAKADTALQSYTETDPIFNAWNKSTGITITESQITDFGDYETRDPNILKNGDIGSSVQPYNANTVVDGSYVRTDNNFTDVYKTAIDKSSAVAGTSTLNRYDKLLANRDILSMSYTENGLWVIRYEEDNSVDELYRDVLDYSEGKLIRIRHFYNTTSTQTPSGITALEYTGDNLTSTNYTE